MLCGHRCPSACSPAQLLEDWHAGNRLRRAFPRPWAAAPQGNADALVLGGACALVVGAAAALIGSRGVCVYAVLATVLGVCWTRWGPWFSDFETSEL